MIQKKTVTLWCDSKGVEHKTLDALKQAEISAILADGAMELVEHDNHAKRVVENATKIIDVLSLTDASIPAARRANGAPPKKRKSRKVIAEQFPLPGVTQEQQTQEDATKLESLKASLLT
jgi:hypothetical protein